MDEITSGQSMNGSWWLVKIEAKRIQTYLFAVPELKAMVGANVILGEALRGARSGCGFTAGSLPAAAVDCGAQTPMQAAAVAAPGSSANDPLGDDDDPAFGFDLGVLVRDASRLWAAFPRRGDRTKPGGEGGALRFIAEAERIVGKSLPGVTLTIRVVELALQGGAWVKRPEPAPHGAPSKSAPKPRGDTVPTLPVLQVCEVSGHGVATRRENHKTGQFVSRDVALRRERSRAMDACHTHDVMGLLRTKGAFGFGAERMPADFHRLAEGGYLAVIHADGNEVGKLVQAVADHRDEFHHWSATERLYHRNRVLMRRAFVDAVVSRDAELAKTNQPTMPLRPLMLGGDDLLLVCRARDAMPIVIDLARRLEELQENADLPLTLAFGVAVARASLPFHRLHALAEDLASSAKRLYRGRNSGDSPWKRSVIDWLTTTATWQDDVGESRREGAIVVGPSGERLVLSRRPLPVLGPKDTLEAYHRRARSLQEAVASRGAARSQLRHLQSSLRRGRSLASLAASELPSDTRMALAEALSADTQPGSVPFFSPWSPVDGSKDLTTSVGDIIELFEIDGLGRRA